MKEAGIDVDIVEDGTTFEENALIKAKAVMEVTGALTLADDSGLEIDALNGEPGIYSSRYLGEDTSYVKKNSVILERLKDVPEEYFERVQSLLENFIVHKKKFKSLTTNKPGFMELKDDQVRIVMKHTVNNIYCVMGVFAKKANNDRKMYRTMWNRTVTDIITKQKEKQELA